MIILDDKVYLSYIIINYMNECFQSSKSYLPYGVVITAIFEAFNISIIDDDEIIKLRPTDIYNYLSLWQMGYIFTNRVWRCIGDMHEEKSDSGKKCQPIHRH